MSDAEKTEKTRNPNRPEYYCFKCKISVHGEDGITPKCGATQCHFTKLPQGKNEFKEVLSELTTKLNKSLEEIEKLKKDLLNTSTSNTGAKK